MRRFLHRWRPGLLLALLAVAAQVAIGVAAPQAGVRATPDQQLAVLLAAPGAICHGDVGGGPPAPHHHGIDCALCPYCAAIATVAVLRGDGPAVPISRAGPILIAIGAPDTILVTPTPRLAARPRGPPVLA